MDDYTHLENAFWNLAVKEAHPYTFTPDCEHEIRLIIKKGATLLAESTNIAAEKLIEAEDNLHSLISLMKESSKDNLLTKNNLSDAKEKICPTWPCAAEEKPSNPGLQQYGK